MRAPAALATVAGRIKSRENQKIIKKFLKFFAQARAQKS
jgi:hypothetical protein